MEAQGLVQVTGEGRHIETLKSRYIHSLRFENGQGFKKDIWY